MFNTSRTSGQRLPKIVHRSSPVVRVLGVVRDHFKSTTNLKLGMGHNGAYRSQKFKGFRHRCAPFPIWGWWSIWDDLLPPQAPWLMVRSGALFLEVSEELSRCPTRPIQSTSSWKLMLSIGEPDIRAAFLRLPKHSSPLLTIIQGAWG